MPSIHLKGARTTAEALLPDGRPHRPASDVRLGIKYCTKDDLQRTLKKAKADAGEAGKAPPFRSNDDSNDKKKKKKTASLRKTCPMLQRSPKVDESFPPPLLKSCAGRVATRHCMGARSLGLDLRLSTE